MRHMLSMREIKPSDVHSGLDESFHLLNFPTSRANGADDFGFAIESVGRILDGIQIDTTTGQNGNF